MSEKCFLFWLCLICSSNVFKLCPILPNILENVYFIDCYKFTLSGIWLAKDLPDEAALSIPVGDSIKYTLYFIDLNLLNKKNDEKILNVSSDFSSINFKLSDLFMKIWSKSFFKLTVCCMLKTFSLGSTE